MSQEKTEKEPTTEPVKTPSKNYLWLLLLIPLILVFIPFIPVMEVYSVQESHNETVYEIRTEHYTEYEQRTESYSRYLSYRKVNGTCHQEWDFTIGYYVEQNVFLENTDTKTGTWSVQLWIETLSGERGLTTVTHAIQSGQTVEFRNIVDVDSGEDYLCYSQVTSVPTTTETRVITVPVDKTRQVPYPVEKTVVETVEKQRTSYKSIIQLVLRL